MKPKPAFPMTKSQRLARQGVLKMRLGLIPKPEPPGEIAQMARKIEKEFLAEAQLKPVKVLKVIDPKVEPKPIANDNCIEVKTRYGGTERVPKSPFASPWSYIDWLERRGWKRLGAGAYSTVLGRDDSDRVIKVSRSLDNWIDYIQWAAKLGYAGNLAPRVYSWKRHGKGEVEETRWEGRISWDWSVAVVERMKATVGNDEKSDASLVLNLTYPAARGNVMAQLYMEELAPGSFKFFKELRENEFASDVGGSNVMIRKDGSLCVTDPTCGRIKTEKKRLRSGDFSPVLCIGLYIESSNRY